MSSNSPKHLIPQTGTKSGPVDSREHGSYSYLPSEVDGTGNSNDRNSEYLSGQQNSSSSIHSVHVGSGRQASLASISSSNSAQNSSARSQMYAGGQSPSIFGSFPSNPTKSLQQRTSFDLGSDSRSASFSEGILRKNLSQTFSIDKTVSGKNLPMPGNDSVTPHVPLVGTAIASGNPPSSIRRTTSPQGATRLAPQKLIVESKHLQSARQGMNTTAHLTEGKARDVYSNNPEVQHGATQKIKPSDNSFATIQRQTSGEPQRFTPNPPGFASAKTIARQHCHPNAPLNPTLGSGPVGHERKRSIPSDTPLSYESHPPAAQKPGISANTPSSFGSHGNIAKVPYHMQTHPPATSQPTSSASNRLPMPITDAVPLQPLRSYPPGPIRPTEKAMRELKVDDALLYLDEVKKQFTQQPAIYNEFLAIMKNFKSQEVDTPGVIARVSKLFQGYNSLILGFNTFLPEGYQITQSDLEQIDAIYPPPERRKPPPKRSAGPKQRKITASSTTPVVLPQVPAPPQIPHTLTQQTPTPQNVTNHHLAPQNITPQTMPTQAIIPPITSLSPKHQVPTVRQTPLPMARGRSPDETIPPQMPFAIPAHLPPQASTQPSPLPPQSQSPSIPVNQSNAPPTKPTATGPTAGKHATVAVTQAQPRRQHQAVEFDHAISYVTKIKKRFANDPGTYHSFLEILHTYQKEQKGIKEVLEQVAHLFQDHPDLLKEFTFFLPDAVQEQAKERLHRAAAESESRQAAQKQQTLEQQNRKAAGDSPQNQQSVIDMTRRGAYPAETDPRGRKRLIDGQPIPMLAQPEMCVYNSAVERQFFDSAREALSTFSRDGGQAWAEFLKCLDMYAQEILSRNEMLDFVEPLLGKRNNNLFEEFKRILTTAGAASGSAALIEDSWYSVPLADIDFSRCRRCSPSYRALPRDYPAHPCSERSESEARVLNDIWVSLPVGSEESYTFRHMRRNTYEESLFRVEDERFEIDMAIDSNMATLYRLEPIAEEIAQLSRADIHPTDLGSKNVRDGKGLGGKRFQYTFDKSVLGVIHRNAIARIYGESGKEMLELLEKNPTVAVPLVLGRLRQKQAEWLKVRARLNGHWKVLAEQNYFRSLDHWSLTWRTIDKRTISTRTLIAEIKDRAANDGRETKEAYRQKLDKAKEEHGTFYEVTVGSKLDQDLDLTYLPKPDRKIFTPHQSLLYTNVSWAQRDAYRILTFALERGQISPADKERCHRLWVEFLGPWFGLSLSWMQKPAAVYQETIDATVISEDDEESADDDANGPKSKRLTRTSSLKEVCDHHPLPAGVHVSTLYGEGKILEFRRSDRIYKIKTGFGAVSFLRPSSVLFSILPLEKSASTRQLRADDKKKLARPHDQLVFGTQSLYLFFRLHHILIQRLIIAKQLAFSVGENSNLQSLVERLPSHNPKTVGKLRYEAYLSLLYSLLDGGMSVASDGGKYEDRVRNLLGHGAYELATMDKLISHIWKEVQTMASDENTWNLVHLYRRHLVTGSFHPEAFRQEVAYMSEGEPLYAFQNCPMHDSDESVLHIEYVGILDNEDDQPMGEAVNDKDIPLSKRTRR